MTWSSWVIKFLISGGSLEAEEKEKDETGNEKNEVDDVGGGSSLEEATIDKKSKKPGKPRQPKTVS